MSKKKILMIIGSLRASSFNRRLAEAAKELIGDRVDVSFLDYIDLPFMNQDHEFPPPEAVSRIRKEVSEADALWIFSPEYNFALPGVLKNLLDWLSRPLTPGGYDKPTAISGKYATSSGAGGRMATAGAQKQLASLLDVMKLQVMDEPQALISLPMQSFMDDSFSLSDEQKTLLSQQAEAFLRFIEKD